MLDDVSISLGLVRFHDREQKFRARHGSIARSPGSRFARFIFARRMGRIRVLSSHIRLTSRS